MPWLANRTLPSPMATLMPPECGDTARHMQTLSAPPHVQGIVVVLQYSTEGLIRGM
jgi:hypothetical protein